MLSRKGDSVNIVAQATSDLAIFLLFAVVAVLLRPVFHRGAYARRGWTTGSLRSDLGIQFMQFTDNGVTWTSRCGWWGGLVAIVVWAGKRMILTDGASASELWDWLGIGLASGGALGVIVAVSKSWFGPIARNLVEERRPIVRNAEPEKKGEQVDASKVLAVAENPPNSNPPKNRQRDRQRIRHGH